MNNDFQETCVPTVASNPIGSLKRSFDEATSVVTESLLSTTEPIKSVKPIFIELCSGSAGLSLAMQNQGFHCVPVDHSRNEHKTKIPTVVLDLAENSQADIVIQLLHSGNVAAVFAGVPCGTAFRAREIALSNGRPGPPQLRSSTCPLGIAGLSELNQFKVDKANRIYSNVARILDVATSLLILIMIENPKNSYLWDINWYSRLLCRGFVDIIFQHCKWNPDNQPSRAKWTRVRTNCKELLELSGQCFRKHVHLAWGVKPDGKFATADEAEYSTGMCQAFAKAIANNLSKKGLHLVPFSANSDIDDTRNEELLWVDSLGGKRSLQ